ncbi:MAG: hypothetical protein MZV70_29930 [Desulfobacterales bacterium]|nr:hypothetical protein [Desulfobacterales bacterium]
MPRTARGAVRCRRDPPAAHFQLHGLRAAVRRSTACTVHFLEQAAGARSGFRAVILPGSKNTRFDLEWLQPSGWAQAIRALSRQRRPRAGHLRRLPDAGRAGSTTRKATRARRARRRGSPCCRWKRSCGRPRPPPGRASCWQDAAEGSGYEIHMGQTARSGGRPLFRSGAHATAQPVAVEDGCSRAGPDASWGPTSTGCSTAPRSPPGWLATIGVQGVRAPGLGRPCRPGPRIRTRWRTTSKNTWMSRQ